MRSWFRLVRVILVICLVAAAAASAHAVRYHTVKRGDSLWKIARNSGTSVYQLKKLNSLSANKPLKLGLKLAIPDSAATTKPIAAANPTPAVPAPETPQVVDRHARLVRTALAYRGARYVRGGTGGRGFDCSGFTRYVYSRYGIKLPHSSSAQSKCGTPVSRAELKEGDLLFFHTRGSRISHVGLYIGGGKFIHASTPRGGVKVSSLGEAYYTKRYRCARRLAH